MQPEIPKGDYSALYLYGSRVYGTAQEHSDWDYLGVQEGAGTGEMAYGLVNLKLMSPAHFQRLLDEHPRADVVVSVSKYHHHPYWALRIEEDRIVPDRPKSATESRQHLPELCHPDGTVYWWRTVWLMSMENIYDGIVIPYRTPADSVLDIDYPDDLKYAEWRMQLRARRAHSN